MLKIIYRINEYSSLIRMYACDEKQGSDMFFVDGVKPYPYERSGELEINEFCKKFGLHKANLKEYSLKQIKRFNDVSD